MQLHLQLYGSVLYLFKYYIKTKKYTWQEVAASKIVKREGLRNIIKNILKVSVPIALCALLSATTKTIDALTIVRVLKNIIGEEEATAQYGILSGKVDTLIMLPFSFNIAFATALVPAISAAIAKRNIDSAERKIKVSILITILIGIPCTIFLSVFAEQILKFLFPRAYLGSTMLKYSALGIIIVVLIQTINGALQGMGKVNISVIAFAIGAIIKLVLNITLIPIIRINGAIYATLISHIVSFIICFIALKQNIDIKFEISKFVIKPIVAASIMICFLFIIYNNLSKIISQNLSLIITTIFSSIIYIITVIFLKILSKEEINMLPYGPKTYKRIKK